MDGGTEECDRSGLGRGFGREILGECRGCQEDGSDRRDGGSDSTRKGVEWKEGARA
jgi:hypothetical protein